MGGGGRREEGGGGKGGRKKVKEEDDKKTKTKQEGNDIDPKNLLFGRREKSLCYKPLLHFLLLLWPAFV